MSTTAKPRARHPFRRVVISGAAVPVLVGVQFAMMAIVPVLTATVSTWRNPSLRRLRPWAAGLTTIYAVPLAMWAIGPDRAPSLSKDMNPVVAAIVSAAGAAFALRSYKLKRESLTT